MQEKKWEETGNWAGSGKIESQKQALCYGEVVLVLTLNFEVGEMLTMRMQEKKWEETDSWAESGKIESQNKHPLFVLTLNRSFRILKRDLYSNSIFNSPAFSCQSWSSV